MFKVGEIIEHQTFGKGEVKEVRVDSNGTQIRVSFQNGYGEKKLSLLVAKKFITRFSEYSHYDEETNDWYNKQGFNERGYDKFGFNSLGFNNEGFNKKGIHRLTGDYFNPSGYDFKGFDRKGFNQLGIHKDTGASYDLNGNYANGVHNSEELVHFIKRMIPPFCEFHFEGFYHMTHFNNAASILKNGKLLPRSRGKMKVDMNKVLHLTNRVINQTHEFIQDHVRLYFRPKTPTFWHFEKEIKDLVILVFSPKILTHPNAKISLGNAGKSFSTLLPVNQHGLSNIDFTRVFLSSHEPENEYEKNLRQIELLIPNELDLTHLKKVIFRNNDDLQFFRGKFGHHNGVSYATGKPNFFKEF